MSSRNKISLARTSIAISLCTFVGTVLVALATDLGVDKFLPVTLPAGAIALSIALVGKSGKGIILSICAALCPFIIFWLSFLIYQILYVISLGHIVPG